MRLGLGTAQFGMDYGITNRAGKVGRAEATRILEQAAGLGVGVLDTAPGYGDSESVLGAALPDRHPFQIVTKTPTFRAGRITRDHAESLELSLRESVARLKQDRIHGLLIHDADDLLVPGGEFLIEAMERCVNSGLVAKVGVSVYSAGQIDGVLRRFEPGIVQLPLSVIDQRLLQSGHLARLHGMGIEIHVRSAFLQGALLAPPPSLPGFLAPLRDKLDAFQSACRAAGSSPLDGAIAFITQCTGISAAIVGVTSQRELLEIAAAARAAPGNLDFSRFAAHGEEMLDLSRWQPAAIDPAGAAR